MLYESKRQKELSSYINNTYFNNLIKSRIMKNVKTVEIESKEYHIIKGILDCVDFWNREGEDIYQKNLTGQMGNKFTNKEAKEKGKDELIMGCLLSDCKAFCRVVNAECGRAGSHIWVHYNDKRILMLSVY